MYQAPEIQGSADTIDTSGNRSLHAGKLFNGVVICLDGSRCAEHAIPHALSLARAAPVTLLQVLEHSKLDGMPPEPLEWNIQRQEARDYLERLATAWRQKVRAPIDCEIIEGCVSEEICARCLKRDVELTVLCRNGNGASHLWSRAGNTRKLIEGVSGSVLLVPAASSVRLPLERYRRILVPLDGSATAESAISAARQLASACGACLILALVVTPPSRSSWIRPTPRPSNRTTKSCAVTSGSPTSIWMGCVGS